MKFDEAGTGPLERSRPAGDRRYLSPRRHAIAGEAFLIDARASIGRRRPRSMSGACGLVQGDADLRDVRQDVGWGGDLSGLAFLAMIVVPAQTWHWGFSGPRVAGGL